MCLFDKIIKLKMFNNVASIVISQIAIIKKIKLLVMYVPFVTNLKENNNVGKE